MAVKMTRTTPQKGGKHKMKRSAKHRGLYAVQRVRTTRNKIRRLRKRVSFDPTAEPAIKRLMIKDAHA